MPKLRCSADSCVHNSSECCCRNEVQVAGHSAGTSDDTCCSNFCEDSGSARNAVGDQQPNYDLDIQCDASNCAHNSGCKCHADAIDVNGYGACKCDETCCSTFVPES